MPCQAYPPSNWRPNTFSFAVTAAFTPCAPGAELPRYALLATIETYVNGGEAMLAVHERLWIRGRHTWSYLTLVLSALSFSLALAWEK